MYRTGRHNRKQLVYWQNGDDIENSELRFVIVGGPIDGDLLVEALNESVLLEMHEEND